MAPLPPPLKSAYGSVWGGVRRGLDEWQFVVVVGQWNIECVSVCGLPCSSSRCVASYRCVGGCWYTAHASRQSRNWGSGRPPPPGEGISNEVRPHTPIFFGGGGHTGLGSKMLWSGITIMLKQVRNPNSIRFVAIGHFELINQALLYSLFPFVSQKNISARRFNRTMRGHFLTFVDFFVF